MGMYQSKLLYKPKILLFIWPTEDVFRNKSEHIFYVILAKLNENVRSILSLKGGLSKTKVVSTFYLFIFFSP